MNKDSFNRSVILKILGVLAFAIGLHWLLQRYELLSAFFIGFLSLLAPLLMGAAIAFIINLPMRLIERLIFRKPYARSEPVFLDRYEKEKPDPFDQTVKKRKKRPKPAPEHQTVNRMSKFKRVFNRTLLIKVRDALKIGRAHV